MALRTFLVVFLFMFSSVSNAFGENFFLKETNCKSFQKSQDRWEEISSVPLSTEELFSGSPLAKRPDLLLIEKDKVFYAIPRECFITEAEKLALNQQQPQQEQVTQPEPSPEVSTAETPNENLESSIQPNAIQPNAIQAESPTPKITSPEATTPSSTITPLPLPGYLPPPPGSPAPESENPTIEKPLESQIEVTTPLESPVPSQIIEPSPTPPTPSMPSQPIVGEIQPKETEITPLQFGGFFGLLSWQESFKLKSTATGNSYDLRGTIIAFNFGGRARYQWMPLFSLESDLGILLGTKEISNASQNLQYYISSGLVFGASATPRFVFEWPKADSIMIAFSAPIIYRFLSVDSPNSSYSTDSGFPLFVGTMIESRFRFQSFQIAPQVGLFRKLDSVALGLELSYYF